MQIISQIEAFRLLKSDQAGWYSADANPPVDHPKQIIVKAEGTFYLLQVPSEMKLELKRVKVRSLTEGQGLWEVSFDDSMRVVVEAIQQDAIHRRAPATTTKQIVAKQGLSDEIEMMINTSTFGTKAFE